MFRATSYANYLQLVDSYRLNLAIELLDIPPSKRESFNRFRLTLPSIHSSQFHLALSKLHQRGVSLPLTCAALQLWHCFCSYTSPPEAIMEQTADGGLRFAWNTDSMYLDVEIYDDATVEWFFEDRQSGFTDGTVEDKEKSIHPAFFGYLSRLSAMLPPRSEAMAHRRDAPPDLASLAQVAYGAPMPCDPKPGLWAYLVCALSALLAHPLQVAASILLLGSAVTAALLARRRDDHRPIAWALGAVVVADLAGVALGPALSSPGPYIGWQRISFHADEARFLVWPLALQWAVGLSFVEPCARSCVRSALRISLVPFYCLTLAICVVCYPALREASLSRFYACIHANALLWSLVVAGTWAGRRWAIRSAAEAGYGGAMLEREALGPLVTPARLVASLLLALSALSAIAGPWWRGLFGPAYDAERVILVAMYAGILGVQAWILRHNGQLQASPLPNPFVHDRPLGRDDGQC